MTQTHAPEPWQAVPLEDGTDHWSVESVDIGAPAGDYAAEAYSEADARRIVACINACAGIPTAELEAAAARTERYPRMVMLAAAVERHTLA